jgi:hypothetical protein
MAVTIMREISLIPDEESWVIVTVTVRFIREATSVQKSTIRFHAWLEDFISVLYLECVIQWDCYILY